MKKHFFVLAAVIISSTLNAQSQLRNGGDTTSTSLDEVVLTANKYPNKTSLTGKVVTIITSEQLERSGGKDAYGRYAIDHTGDSMSREIFCLVLGPAGIVKQNQVITSIVGESIDVVPTIADALGFYSDIPSNYRANMGSPLAQAFI